MNTSDLWNSFSTRFLNNLTAKQLMENWFKDCGYPLVNVTVNYTTNTINVTQKAMSDQHSLTIWPIPLSYIVSSKINGTKHSWILTKELDIKLEENILNNTWVLFNSNQRGRYIISILFFL